MRKLFIGIFLSFCLLLSGCGVFSGLFEPLHGDKQVQEDPAVMAARTLINELNASLTSLNSAIEYNFDQKLWSKAKAQEYLDKSKKLGERLDQAREALRLGNPGDAKAQAELIKRALNELHRIAAAASEKGTRNELLENPGPWLHLAGCWAAPWGHRDLCAGEGGSWGFTGRNHGWPAADAQGFRVAFAGEAGRLVKSRLSLAPR